MGYRRRLKYYFIKLFRLHDSPRAIAGGFACGTVSHFYPTWGFGYFFSVGLAGILRTNLPAATLGWAIMSPLFPFFFYLNFLMGELFVRAPRPPSCISIKNFSYGGWKNIVFFGKAFVVGSLINGPLALLFFWWIGYVLFKKYRKKLLCFIRRVL